MDIWKFLRYIKHVKLFKYKGCLIRNTKNTKRIRELENCHDGERCFIVATGPSLSPTDLELLRNEDTFGVNSIFLMYEKTDWRPRYYVCTDASYLSKLIAAYDLKAEMLCQDAMFLNAETKKMNPSFIDDKIRWIRFSPWNRIYDFYKYQFLSDISYGMFAFGTVTNIAIAIAMYLGYKEIYLLGADCNNLNKHFVNDVTDEGKDEKYVNDVIRIQLAGYEIMKKETLRRNVKVINVTRGGALEVFPRMMLEDVLSKRS